MPTPALARTAARTSVRVDAVCAAATDLAREILVAEVGSEYVGEHRRTVGVADRLVEHQFASSQPGYVGWIWSVTVARSPRAKHATVCEVALIPAAEAVLAPVWVPWDQRLRPGDVGVGDLLPAAPDDERLMSSFLLSEDSDQTPDFQTNDSAALGRPRVMSFLGREQTAERWYESQAGPDVPIAKAAPGRCGSCGFYLALAGSMGSLFGACGNVYAPDDGRVVSADHGCGAHSEAVAS